MKATNCSTICECNVATAALPFTIQNMQDLYQEVEDTTPGRNDHFKIVWVMQNKGTSSLSMETFEIQNNWIFCIKPGQKQALPTVENTEGFVISFTEDFLNAGDFGGDSIYQANLIGLLLETRGIQVKHESVADIKEVVGKMVKEYENGFLLKWKY